MSVYRIMEQWGAPEGYPRRPLYVYVISSTDEAHTKKLGTSLIRSTKTFIGTTPVGYARARRNAARYVEGLEQMAAASLELTPLG